MLDPGNDIKAVQVDACGVGNDVGEVECERIIGSIPIAAFVGGDECTGDPGELGFAVGARW